MRNLVRAAFLTLLVSMLVVPAHAQQWQWVRSPNYSVLTDAGDSDARQLALRLEQMRTTYAAIFHREGKMGSPAHTVVFAMRDPRGMASLGIEFKSAAAGNPRVYRGIERWFLNGFQLNSNGTLAESAHNDGAMAEVAHMLLENNYPRTPAWFDSGLEDYLAALKTEKENIVMGRTPERMPQGGAGLPLVQLLSVTAQPAEAEKAALFRHKSWLLVHWILTNGRLSDAGRYFDMVMNQGLAPREACLRAFSMSPEEWDKELSDYKPEKNVRTFPFPYVDVAKFLARKITVTEAKVAVADMALDAPEDEEAAMKALTGIMQQSPTIPEVHRALAYGYVRRKDLDNGMEHVQRAMRLHDSDPLMHYLEAVVLNNGVFDAVAVESADVRLSPALTNAIKMDPQFARAYVLRGLARLAADRNDLALADLKTAAGLRPRDEQALLALAQAQGATGDLQSARGLYALLSRSANQAVAEKAKQGYSNAGREQREKKKLEAEGYATYRDQTDPRWRVPSSEGAEDVKKETGPDTRKTEYLKGTLVDVQCGDNGSATLRVSSAGKAWRLDIASTRNVLLMNRENFSCAWKNVRVGVNYKPSGAQSGDVVSIELTE